MKCCGKLGLGVMWLAKVDGHVRCMVGIVVWGRMYGNREFGGEPGSLLLYIISDRFLPVGLHVAGHERDFSSFGCVSGFLQSFSLWLFDTFSYLCSWAFPTLLPGRKQNISDKCCLQHMYQAASHRFVGACRASTPVVWF